MASAGVASEMMIKSHSHSQLANTASKDGDGDRDKGKDKDNGGDEDASKKNSIRKRTKTGCLTCRKRRIKCDEGRPICNNCTKSKRNCEGYNQRVVFKEPIGAYHGGTFGPVVYPPESPQHHLPFPPIETQQPRSSSSQVPHLTAIAPKPPPPLDFQPFPPIPHGQPYLGQLGLASAPAAVPAPYSFHQARYAQQPPPAGPPLVSPNQPFQLLGGGGPQEFGQPYLLSPSSEDTGFGSQQHPAQQGLVFGNDEHEHARANTAPGQKEHGHLSAGRDPLLEHQQTDDDDATMDDSDDELQVTGRENTYGSLVQSHMDGPLEGFGTRIRTFSTFAETDLLTSYFPSASNSPLNDGKTAALFWHFVNVTGPSMSLYERHPLDYGDTQSGSQYTPNANINIWTYTFPIIAFHHPALLHSMLAIASLQVAKLQEKPATAALKHYHLAIRRLARNVQSHNRRTQPATLASTLLLAYFEVWNSDHSKWCQHLYGARILIKEMSFKEMTRNLLPLKRAKRAVYEERRRQLLDPYAMGQDCYSSNAAPPGADDLDDIDAGFISQITGQHVRYEDDEPLSGLYYTDRDIEQYEHLRDLFWWFSKMDVYQSLLSGGKPFMEFEHRTECPPRAPMGRLEAIYGTHDHLILVMTRLMTFAAKDLPRKRKAMRTYGFMGGPLGAAAARGNPNPTNSSSSRGQDGLSQGPLPHAPPGGMPYGMGRSGGCMPAMPSGGASSSTGMPPPGMSGGGGPPQGAGASPPMFPGMLPTGGSKVTLPMGFTPPREATPPATAQEKENGDTIDDLEQATAEATLEWEAIHAAFEALRARFGPEFEPLGPEYADRRDSPFGPTLQYRTFSVAGVWLNYYMGLIHLYRTHPRMPPAAMIAQGIQAKLTGRYAAEIGRIAAGMSDDLVGVTEISTLAGAALVECCLPLFVGGIQYQEDVQRHWVFRRLHDIARLTGWQSARQIAEGCESGWRKAADLGKGPPYTRDPSLDREIPRSLWTMPKKIASQIEELESQGRQDNKLVVARSDQAGHAIGLLTIEKELDRLDLEGS